MGIIKKLKLFFKKRRKNLFYLYNISRTRKFFIGGSINSSAEIQPHCLSSGFVLCTKHRVIVCSFAKAKLLEKTFFANCYLLQKVFIGVVDV